MKTIHLITDADDDDMPIGAADTLDDAIWLADEWFGATEKFEFNMRRTDIKKYDYKYGGEILYGTITYEGDGRIQKANIWEIDFYPEQKL
jgi:hypothetical protein